MEPRRRSSEPGSESWPVVDLASVQRRLREEIERCVRNQGRTAVLVVDVRGLDGLQPAGRAADVIRQAVRIVDVVGWEAGPEVVVVLPDTGENADTPARRILAGLAEFAPRTRLGIALCPSDAQEAGDLVTGARQAAQAAAEGGFSRVSAYARPLLGGRSSIIAVDPGSRRLLDLVERLARSDLPVLVTGETGVGKELVARALHEWSARHDRPMVTINCAALAETLFENELFGHERGAFTDAGAAKPGLLESARGGTVLLDEVAECAPRIQAKLLRVLETGRASRLGSVVEREVDVRIVAATNCDLVVEMTAGRFRRDLFFRLGAAAVFVPPLRDRKLDIPVLARAFLDGACLKTGRSPMVIAPEALRRLVLHPWPGNVRELRNLLDFCASVVDGDVLEPAHLPPDIAGSTAPWLARTAPVRGPGPAGPTSAFEPFEGRRHRAIHEEIASLERTRIRESLAAAGGVQVRAAHLLEMPLRTFVTKRKDYAITGPSAGPVGPGDTA